MGRSNVSIPVFIHTNLRTRIAIPVSPNISTTDFKGEVERVHFNCFPEFGSIKVNALMVKKKSCYYHLSESFPLKYAFLGSNVTWFLQINVHSWSILNHAEPSKCNGSDVRARSSVANVVSDSVELGGFMMSANDKRTKCKQKKVKIRRFPYREAPMLKISAVVPLLKRKRKRINLKKKHKTGYPEQGPLQGPLIEKEMLCQDATRAEVKWSKMGDKNVTTDTLSEPTSVSGIIKKYFTDYDEVASSFTAVGSRQRRWLDSSNEHQYLDIQSPQFDVWLANPSYEASKEKRSKPEVGKRLLLASDSLGLTPSNRQTVLSLCKYTDGKSPLHKSSVAPRNLVFEMAEECD